jgi:GPN-loop GTPase
MAAQFELHEEDLPPAASPAAASQPGNRPACCLVVGMAGAGKTTLMQRLNHYALEQEQAAGSSVDPTYYVNMDPAVKQVPFAAGIDIRDTVDYKQVMKQYNLGPNGGIMTSLNLFATRFDQVK